MSDIKRSKEEWDTLAQLEHEVQSTFNDVVAKFKSVGVPDMVIGGALQTALYKFAYEVGMPLDTLQTMTPIAYLRAVLAHKKAKAENVSIKDVADAIKKADNV